MIPVSITLLFAVPTDLKFSPYGSGGNSIKGSAPVRKVIQISTMFHPEKDWAFIALCDDGSLWLYHGSWSQIQDIPQTTDLWSVSGE
jgi:hypothetical protein